MSRPLEPKGYTLIEHIAKGGFSDVWLGKHNESEKEIAIKVFCKRNMNTKKSINDYKSEVEIHKQLVHPYLVRFFETKENTFYYYIMMEYVNGNTLKSLIRSDDEVEESAKRNYVVQVLMAIDYLQSIIQVCHMDLKSSNILIDQDNNVRLIDFGISRQISNGSVTNDKQGTLYYFAPERFTNEEVTPKVDVWSFGVILYFMFTKKLPFVGIDNFDTAHRIQNNEPEYPETIPEDICDLIKKCLVKDPEQRISLTDIKKIEWIADQIFQYQASYANDGALSKEVTEIHDIIARSQSSGSKSTKLRLRREKSNAYRRMSSSGRFKIIDSSLAVYGSAPNLLDLAEEN